MILTIVNELKGQNMEKIFKAGKYYIGDPCYVISDDNWSAFCDKLFSLSQLNDSAGGNFDFFGSSVFAASTMWGDGEYEDQDGNSYGVDAGLLGCVPFELSKLSEEMASHLGRVITFDQPFTVERNASGTFYFGHIVIHTDSNDEEEDTAWDDETFDWDDE